MTVEYLLLNTFFLLLISTSAAQKPASVCTAADETPVLVQLVGYETVGSDRLDASSNLRSSAATSVTSIWELQYTLRYRDKSATYAKAAYQSQQVQQQYEHRAQDVLSFGASMAAHSICVSRDRDYELLLEWADHNDVDADAEERPTRPQGASLCGGKYLVPIGRSISLSQAVLSDCFVAHTEAAAASSGAVAIAAAVDEEQGRRQLQETPTSVPTVSPTFACIPTSPPSGVPSGVPTQRPSEPTSVPTATPTVPTSLPSAMPTVPTSMPSSTPTQPTSTPTADPNPEEEEGSSNSGGSSSGGGGGAMAFFQSDEGYGTIAAAGVVGLGLLATGVYFLWQYSGDLVKAPLAPQELAMQI